jgi:hypothetical protein
MTTVPVLESKALKAWLASPTIRVSMSRSRGFRAGTKKGKLAGQLGKYTKAMMSGNKLAKRQARNGIAALIGV